MNTNQRVKEMTMFTLKSVFVMLLIAFPIPIMAQSLPAAGETAGQSASESLRGKHGIELSLGLLSDINATTELSGTGTTVGSEANGLIASIAYYYWLENDLAITASVGVVDADASTSASGSGVFMESAAVVPVLFGAKYSPLALALADVVRPYLTASIGPYFGFASEVRAGTNSGTESRSEAALGSRFGLGIDLSVSKSFRLGLGIGYRLVSDFENRIGSEKNHSSPEFSFFLGFVF